MALKVRADRPIDRGLHAILAHAKAATQALGIGVFVGGAMARDIMLSHVHGHAVHRATRDVDIGLYIDSWERFTALKNRLTATGAFFELHGMSHRMHYLRPGGIPLNLIPFGGVAGDDQTITWPPGHDVVLNVAGFREGLDSADLVDLAGAALLGKDAAILCSPGTAQQVHVILADPDQMLDALLRVRNQLAMGGDGQRLRAFIAGYRNGFLGQRAAERGGAR